MGRSGNWFSSLKRILSPKKSRSKKNVSSEERNVDLVANSSERTSTLAAPAPAAVPSTPPPPPPPPPQAPSKKDVTLAEAENEQSKHAYSVALATAAAAEAAVAAAQAAVEVVRLTSVAHYPGKSKEEIAAIRIQTAFRGYLARRALRALRGLVRLKSLIQGHSVKRQATTTLRAMQSLACVQSQIRARRIRMSEENQDLQRQLQQKHEKELEKLKASTSGQWDVSAQSKEQVEANQQHRQEAAIRRERALAYAHSHQQTWRHPSKSATPTFLDPNNPEWGWSWLERWMAARPWESRSTVDNNDQASVKSTSSRALTLGEISRAYHHRDLSNDSKPSPSGQKSSRPPSRQSPSTPHSKAPSTSSVAGKTKLPSRRGSNVGAGDESRRSFGVGSDRHRRHSIGGSSSSVRDDESPAQKSSRPPSRQSPSTPHSKAPSVSSVAGKTKPPSPRGSNWGTDDESRSLFCVQSDRHRRHSIGGSSMRDDESLASSPSVPSYMAQTKSANARSSRLQSPMGLDKNGTPEKPSLGSAKKRLSFSGSPATGLRRHSGPPRIDFNALKDIEMQTEEKYARGASTS